MTFTVLIALVVLWLPLPSTPQPSALGHWKAVFVGPGPRPKMVPAITFTLETTPDGFRGEGRASSWPGDLTLSDIAIDGDHVFFKGTGQIGWRTSAGGPLTSHCCPQLTFEGTVSGEVMNLNMTWRSTENPDDKDGADGMPASPMPMMATRVVVPQDAR